MKTLTINLTNGTQITVQYEHVHTLNVFTTLDQEDLLAEYYDVVEEAIVQRELTIHYYGGKTSLPVDKLLQYQPYSGGTPGRLYQDANTLHTQDSLCLREALTEQINQVLNATRESSKFSVPDGYVAQDCSTGVKLEDYKVFKRVYKKLGRPSHIKG